jgi:signal transduction histidine kinase
MLYFSERNTKDLVRNYSLNAHVNEQVASFLVLIDFTREYILVNPTYNLELSNLLESIELNDFLHSISVTSINGPVFYPFSFNDLNDHTFSEIATRLINLCNYGNLETSTIKIHEAISVLVAPEFSDNLYSPLLDTGNEFIHIYKKYKYLNLTFFGDCISLMSKYLCEINLLINNVTNFHLQVLDESYFAREKILPRRFNSVIDIAICVTGYSTLRLRAGKFVKKNSNIIPTIEYAIAEAMLLTVAREGKVIIAVSENFLYISQGQFFRQKYVDNYWLKQIIDIPTKRTDSIRDIKISVLLIDKHINDASYDQFTEFSSFGLTNDSIKVDKNELADNAFSFLRRRYIKSREFANIISTINQPVVILKSLVEKAAIGRLNRPEHINREPISYENLPYIRLIDLARNGTDIYLDIENTERRISAKYVNEQINYSAVLVGLLGRNLRPSFFRYLGNAIALGPEVMALKIDDNTISEYIVAQLYSNFVKIQVEGMGIGSAITRVRRADLLNIKIILPSLEEQRRQVSELNLFISEKSIAHEKVTRAEEQLNNTEYEVIANINHSLKNKLGVIINDYNTILNLLKQKDSDGIGLKLNDLVRPAFDGEDLHSVDTVDSVTSRIKENLYNASNVFRNAEKLQNMKLNLVKVNIIDYFIYEIKPQYSGENYIIEIKYLASEKLFCMIDKDAFKDIIENLVENAKVHGFLESEKIYHIVFEITRKVYYENEQAKSYARILYMNDGKAFATGFTFDDFKHFLSKEHKSKGAGIGGYVINRIIELHKGKLILVSEKENNLPSFSVQFEILIPLEI